MVTFKIHLTYQVGINSMCEDDAWGGYQTMKILSIEKLFNKH